MNCRFLNPCSCPLLCSLFTAHKYSNIASTGLYLKLIILRFILAVRRLCYWLHLVMFSGCSLPGIHRKLLALGPSRVLSYRLRNVSNEWWIASLG